jgi:CheY-like chemotaxis protein
MLSLDRRAVIDHLIIAIPFVQKILIVDDNHDVCEVISRLVNFMGYQTINAASARECFEKAVSEIPDLIVLDIGLPDMDGRHAARFLRSVPATKDIPILAFIAMYGDLEGKSCPEKLQRLLYFRKR